MKTSALKYLVSGIVRISAVALVLSLAAGCGELRPEPVEVGVFHAINGAAKAFEASVLCSDLPELPMVGGKIELPSGARNCKAKINSLTTTDGKFVPVAGSGFNQHVVGEMATFTNNKGALLFLSILQQLPNPISSAASAAYSYREIRDNGELKAGNKIAVSLSAQGEDAPYWTITSVSRGDTSLDLMLQCREPIGGTLLASATCVGKPIADMRLRLVDHPSQAITASLLGQLAASDKPISELSSFLVLPSATNVNGGLYVTLAFNGVSPKDQLLILRDKEGQSFLYGAIRFSPVTSEAQLHVISVYTTRNGGKVTVDTGADTVLALAAYDQTTWTLDIKAGTTVKKILLYGYYQHSVAGVPSGTEIVRAGTQYAYTLAAISGLAQNIGLTTGLKVRSYQGSYEGSQFLVRSHTGEAIPTDAEFHFVGMYAPANYSYFSPYQQVNVNVDKPNKKVVLVLGSYESVRWNVTATASTQIVGIIYGTYSGAIVQGVSTPVLMGGYSEKSYAYNYADAGAWIGAVSSLIGRNVNFGSFVGSYYGSSFEVK
jgi:hypothetical protein